MVLNRFETNVSPLFDRTKAQKKEKLSEDRVSPVEAVPEDDQQRGPFRFKLEVSQVPGSSQASLCAGQRDSTLGRVGKSVSGSVWYQ